MMFDHQIEESIRNLAEQIKSSEEYHDYQKINEEVKKEPELKEQIDFFRKRNYEMINSQTEEDWLSKSEKFEQEYADFRKTPLVDQFLASELALCRLLQRVSYGIFGSLDFDVSFLQ